MATPKLPADLEASLADYAARLRARFGGRLSFVRLFGSWARGQASELSDVDVAVVVRGLTADEWRAALELAGETELEGGLPLSVLAISEERLRELQSQRRRLARDILHQGVAV